MISSDTTLRQPAAEMRTGHGANRWVMPAYYGVIAAVALAVALIVWFLR